MATVQKKPVASGTGGAARAKKVVLLPLDERPCNFYFPQILPHKGFNLVMPPAELLGDKKKPAAYAPLKEWLMREAADADCLILSMDMLLYGGIVPSRLHNLSLDEIKSRVRTVRALKEKNKKLTLYLFQLIMRCPWYSSDDEEPDYYRFYGREIHHLGRLTHLKQIGAQLSEEDVALWDEIEAKLDKNCLNDYKTRRDKNTDALMYALELVKDGTADYFVVPQDDSAPYGFTALDQIKVRGFIKDNSLQAVSAIYPGADEVGLTLLSRFICRMNKVTPRFFVKYASERGGSVTPSYEDRPVDETVKYQIIAAGGVRVYSLPEANILLAVNIGGDMSEVSDVKNPSAYDVNRNLTEFEAYIEYALSKKLPVALADTAYANGGDEELVRLLCARGLLYKINSYAGWNTSSNTLGTAVCEAVASVYAPDKKTNDNFLTHRYLEDVCYCAHTRKKIIDGLLPSLGLNYFNAGGRTGAVADAVKAEILAYAKKNLPEVYNRVKTLEVTQPWARMFETFIKVNA